MKFLAKRLLTYLAVFLVVLNLDFILPRLSPGNAAEVLVNEGEFNQALQLAQEEARLGLNHPLFYQYTHYLQGIFLSWPPNLGVSFEYNPLPVLHLLDSTIESTIIKNYSSFLHELGIAYVLAIFSAQKRGGKAEMVGMYSSVTFQALPLYWTGIILIWVFASTLHLFPTFGNVGAVVSSPSQFFVSVIWHSVLPIITMTGAIFGGFYLVLRSTTQQVLQSDYVIAAKTRGLRSKVIATGYVLRNSLLPLVSIMSFSLAGLISRAVIVEAVFGYLGVGDLLADALANFDYPVLEGTFLMLTLIVIAGGIIGDVLLVRLDPRLRS